MGQIASLSEVKMRKSERAKTILKAKPIQIRKFNQALSACSCGSGYQRNKRVKAGIDASETILWAATCRLSDDLNSKSGKHLTYNCHPKVMDTGRDKTAIPRIIAYHPSKKAN